MLVVITIMELIKKGAEADIYRMLWDGHDAIMKIRKPKSYRNAQLDTRIRHQRTVRESNTISTVRTFGIPTPLIYLVDAKKSAIIMQYVKGTTVQSLPDDLIINLSGTIGRLVGILHKNGIMHGDLTTSNFVYDSERNMVYMLDFGLSQNTLKSEDHAVDMRLIKEIFNSAHARIMDSSWKKLLQGYTSVVGYDRCSQIKQLVLEIEGRGRYATVV